MHDALHFPLCPLLCFSCYPVYFTFFCFIHQIHFCLLLHTFLLHVLLFLSKSSFVCNVLVQIPISQSYSPLRPLPDHFSVVSLYFSSFSLFINFLSYFLTFLLFFFFLSLIVSFHFSPVPFPSSPHLLFIVLISLLLIAVFSSLGGTSRVSIVKRRLGGVLGLDPAAINYGLKTTMNSDEAVARGEIEESRVPVDIPFSLGMF